MVIATVAAIALVLAAVVFWLSHVREKHYDRLSELIRGFVGDGERFAPLSAVPAPAFSERITTISHLLPEALFDTLRDQANKLVTSERSYIPTHKKGGTVAYETVIEKAPDLAALYHSPGMRDLISKIVGEPVQPTPLHDQSSLSVLFYDRPGDHIGWHYDHNFYLGRHFTVLVPLVNDGHGDQGLSHAQFVAKLGDEERFISTPPNALVMFEGASVLHRVTPIEEGERRMVVSMTYCSDPRSGPIRGAARRIKDMAFFGVRALWT